MARLEEAVYHLPFYAPQAHTDWQTYTPTLSPSDSPQWMAYTEYEFIQCLVAVQWQCDFITILPSLSRLFTNFCALCCWIFLFCCWFHSLYSCSHSCFLVSILRPKQFVHCLKTEKRQTLQVVIITRIILAWQQQQQQQNSNLKSPGREGKNEIIVFVGGRRNKTKKTKIYSSMPNCCTFKRNFVPSSTLPKEKRGSFYSYFISVSLSSARHYLYEFRIVNLFSLVGLFWL